MSVSAVKRYSNNNGILSTNINMHSSHNPTLPPLARAILHPFLCCCPFLSNNNDELQVVGHHNLSFSSTKA